MAKIKVLPEDVARQIAAGEVVERPASVVKELIENAIDSGAGVISIRVEGAGVGLIEVRDDGHGMAADDVELAARSFSTSKIAHSGDLDRIATFGFRGEALASISAVSRFEIVSADTAGGEGWRFACGGEVSGSPAPRERGTTVRVRELFFNTPARRKFLKSGTTERRRMLETVLAFALIFPDLEFHYAVDGRSELDLIPAPSWRDRVAAILSGDVMKHIVDLDAGVDPLRLKGFTSLPAHTRANRNQQFIYVNRRLVREKTIQQAVQLAYRSVIPYKRFPVIVLSLEVPCEQVDVNVHPNKLEVRLRNERGVFELVQRALKQALSAHSESTLRVRYDRIGTPPVTPAPSPFGPAGLASTGTESGERKGAMAPGVPADRYRSRIKDAYASYMEGSASRKAFNPQLSLKNVARKAPPEPAAVEELKEEVGGDDALFWQFNNAYIFIQVRGGIVVIDQHAAHERIIFDTSKNRFESEIPLSQQMLFPIHLELSIGELEVFRSSGEVFRKLGFHLEPFGGKSILVRGTPQGLKNWEEGKLLLQIFDDIAEDRVPGNSHADRIIASFACRSAVKAGQQLATEEMKMLADQLFAVANPYSCPHGRPTIQRISIEEIEGWFLRR
ncbi:MAG: DNA mismatch repair endonuclease MutL [Candidatus Krumholzibacteriia bacterium]